MISPFAFALSANRSLFSPHHISERGSISAGRVPRPSHSTHPLHANESRERRGKKATTVGRHERGRAIAAVARTSERRKTERGKDGRDPTRPCGEGEGRTQGENASAPRATHHILLSRLPTLTAEAPFDEERHVGECLRRVVSARKEKSATHDDTRRANTREATRRVRIRARARARGGYDRRLSAAVERACGRGGARTPTRSTATSTWTLPPVSSTANHLAKIVPLSAEGKEPRRRLCHHQLPPPPSVARESSLVGAVSLVIGPPPLARYYRYSTRQRHRHCVPVASSYDTAINRHLAESRG